MKTLRLTVEVSNEEYAAYKAGQKVGIPDKIIYGDWICMGLRDVLQGRKDFKEECEEYGKPLEDDVKTFFKEYYRVMKMLEKKQ